MRAGRRCCRKGTTQQPDDLCAQLQALGLAARMQQRDPARQVIKNQQRLCGEVGGLRPLRIVRMPPAQTWTAPA